MTAEAQTRMTNSTPDKTIKIQKRQQSNMNIGPATSNLASTATSGRGSSVSNTESPRTNSFTSSSNPATALNKPSQMKHCVLSLGSDGEGESMRCPLSRISK